MKSRGGAAGAAHRIRRQPRGFALLIVLWALALLGLIGTQLISRARGEAGVAFGAREAASLQAAADGGVNAAVFHLLAREWESDGQSRASGFGRIGLTTTVTNEAGRINPNSCPKVLLRALLHVLGLDTTSANDIATAMVMWRTNAEAVRRQYQFAGRDYVPAGAPFQYIDEIGLVLGVTPDLLARLKPHLSLYQEGDVDIRFADPIVARAIDEAGAAATPLRALGVQLNSVLVRVSVTAAMPRGGRFVRMADIRFAPGTATERAAYEILSWENE